MSTEKQILANRRNAQLSTGPRTERGKRSSSLNAYRHGLTGQVEILTDEEQSAHDEFCSGIVDSLNPSDALERQLAQSVAEGHWRLNRVRAIENNVFMLASHVPDHPDGFETTELEKAIAMANGFVEHTPRFQLLTVYEMRIHRKTRNDLQQLKELQAVRRAEAEKRNDEEAARRAQALDDARVLLAHEPSPAEALPEFHHPNGFVFSTAELLQSLRFEQRLGLARQALKATSASAEPPLRSPGVHLVA